jgi:iron(III) transport system ATP-binding protein
MYVLWGYYNFIYCSIIELKSPLVNSKLFVIGSISKQDILIMIRLTLENITKSYTPEKKILNNINLSIEPGELFFLLGPSGCGKSTLLRLVAGFIQPDSGKIIFGDKDVTNLPPEKRDCAMVFQNYALWPHMTLFENVAFGLQCRKTSKNDIKKAVDQALELVGLSELANRKPPSLSGGQQQRVALARAIVVRPQLLLLDEPLSNLDAALRSAMRVEIRRICKQAELTAVYVTHDRKEALSMGDRLALFNDGQISQIGSPYEVYRKPENLFAAKFIGESNLIHGELKPDNTVVTPLGTFRGRLEGGVKPGKAAVIIRPQYIQLNDSADNVFEATLTGGAFLGESGEWYLESGDVRLTVFEPAPIARKNGAVKCSVNSDDIIIVPVS